MIVIPLSCLLRWQRAGMIRIKGVAIFVGRGAASASVRLLKLGLPPRYLPYAAVEFMTPHHCGINYVNRHMNALKSEREIMKLIASLASIAILLSGCASSKAIQGPNGEVAYFIKCGSAVIDACYEKAAKVCPAGYTIASQQTTRGPNSLLVECKK